MSDKNAVAQNELLEIANDVRKCATTFNGLVKKLLANGVEVQFFLNGKELPDGIFGKDFEVRMLIPQEPVEL